MSKLLNRSLKVFILYAAFVLACSIPVYYLIVDYIWKSELDEHNVIIGENIKKRIQSVPMTDVELEQSILLWNKLQPHAQIKSTDRGRPDSIYNIYKKREVTGEMDRFQGLITYFEYNGRYYCLMVETNIEESYETIAVITVITIVFFIILLGGLILLNRNLSKALWQPFYQILEKIRGFSLEKGQKITFDDTGISEFNELNESLDRLIKGNINVYQEQKEFTENVSHELQTPLAIVQSKLDLLLQDRELTTEQYNIINDAQAALGRSARINKTLLLFARIGNGQFTDKEPVNLEELVHSNLDLLTDFVKEKHLHAETEALTVTANRLLVEMMVANLLLNAIRHSAADANINITLDNGTLKVANSGSAPLEQKNLFRRFMRAASQTPGTGLGLALVREICQRYRWEITYHFEDGMHVFRVAFS